MKNIYEEKWKDNPHDQLMDEDVFKSETFQRPYQYLTHHGANKLMQNLVLLDEYGSPAECIHCLLE